MNLTVIEATQNPMDVISLAAGTCYGKSDSPHTRVANCVKLGHTSILEHAKFTLRIEGISRACSHQLVRHRMASYCQQSQRYCKYDLEGNDWYVMPPDFVDNYDAQCWFDDRMTVMGAAYRHALKQGMKPEDARYLLPEATKTTVVMSMNARELLHFLDLRADKTAQWEIRDLAFAILTTLSAIDEQWEELCNLWVKRKGE